MFSSNSSLKYLSLVYLIHNINKDIGINPYPNNNPKIILSKTNAEIIAEMIPNNKEGIKDKLSPG
jgi:hypothetical protein